MDEFLNKHWRFFLGLLALVALLVFVGLRGGSLGIPMPWGDAGLTIPGPGQETPERRIPSRREEQSVVGKWGGALRWPNRNLIVFDVFFASSGTYEISVSGRSVRNLQLDPGTWVQEGNIVTMTSSSGTVYQGTIYARFLHDRKIEGVTSNPSGTFYLYEGW